MHILFSALTEALVVLAALHLVTLGQYAQLSSFRFSSLGATGILSLTPAKCLLFFTSDMIANPVCGKLTMLARIYASPVVCVQLLDALATLLAQLDTHLSIVPFLALTQTPTEETGCMLGFADDDANIS
jgi:hypothetical protein